MMIYTVRMNGKPIKNFYDKSEANLFMQWLMNRSQEEVLCESLIEAALAKSDMSEANVVIKHIMELKSENKNSSK
jgi:hypothetical protein